jgi:integrase/recombinase XerD
VRVRHAKGYRQREMPCPETIAAVLQAWIAIRGPWPGPFLTRMFKPDILIQKRLDRRSINVILKNRRKVAGVGTFTPHDMRRSFISNLLDVGVDISMAQKLAGHLNITTTQLYDRRGEKSKRADIERLPFPQ